MPAKIIIYSTATCPYCDMAKELFKAKNASFEEIRVDTNPGKRDEMIQLAGRRTVPQIFINDQHIGGYDDLSTLQKAGKLDELLK